LNRITKITTKFVSSEERNTFINSAVYREKSEGRHFEAMKREKNVCTP